MEQRHKVTRKEPKTLLSFVIFRSEIITWGALNEIVPAFRRTCHNFKIVCVHLKKKSKGCLSFHMNTSQWKMLAAFDQLSNKSDVMKK